MAFHQPIGLPHSRCRNTVVGSLECFLSGSIGKSSWLYLSTLLHRLSTSVLIWVIYFHFAPILLVPPSPIPPYPNTATSVMARGFTAQTRSLLSSALQPTSAEWSGAAGASRVLVQVEGYGPPETDFGGGFDDGPGSRRHPRRRSSSNRSACLGWGC